jgi:hypothetical protein
MEILAGCNRRLIHQGGAALKRLGLPYLLFTGALLHEVPAVVRSLMFVAFCSIFLHF